MFQGLYQCVQGFSHIEKDVPCQDNADIFLHEKYAVAAAADGHGSKRHFRSQFGSQAAVEAAIEAISIYMADFNAFSESLRADPGKVLRNIEKNILNRWNEKIFQHHSENPVTEEEKSGFTDEELDKLKIETMYGTTLLAAVLTEDYSFGLHIGDGVMVEAGVEEIHIPIAEDENTPANLTASLCNSCAIDYFRHYYKEEKNQALFVSTDGLYTSFDSEESFKEYHRILLNQLEDPELLEQRLKKNFEKRTEIGSQDDISIAIVYNKEDVDEKTEGEET